MLCYDSGVDNQKKKEYSALLSSRDWNGEIVIQCWRLAISVYTVFPVTSTNRKILKEENMLYLERCESFLTGIENRSKNRIAIASSLILSL